MLDHAVHKGTHQAIRVNKTLATLDQHSKLVSLLQRQRVTEAASLQAFFHSQASRYTKLEKADILEMTVYHLRNLRYQRAGEKLMIS